MVRFERASSLKTTACVALFVAITAFSQEPVPSSVTEFSALALESTWQEVSPQDSGTAHLVTAKIWNAAIQAALDKFGAIHIPTQTEPYYLNGPIVLRSGQRLTADPRAELRLVPNVNTCMVRNEHLVGFADQPVPADTGPDTDIIVEGGIWTTLSAGVKRANGNTRGASAVRDPVPGTHGVILLQNVRHVTVRNITVRQSLAFAVHLANVDGFTVEGVRLEAHGRDGVHVNGPASNGVIRDITGDARDDIVSLCAWDWKNYASSFGAIHHITVAGVVGVPLQKGSSDSIRLLPGIKRFPDGRELDCPIHDIVIEDITDIREFKLYDQPNLELGRDKDFSAGVGKLENITLRRLTFSRPGVIQVAENVEGLAVEGVKIAFRPAGNFKLIEIGPMSGTYRHNAADPSTWVELFSPDRDITVRGFALRDVQIDGQAMPGAASSLVQIADQHLNLDYPKTTPRGGRGRVRMDAP